MSRQANDSVAKIYELPVWARLAALEARIAELEEQVAQLEADNLRLETALEEAEYTDETVAHIAGFVIDLGLLIPLSQLPFRLRLATEELCTRIAVPRPWTVIR